MLGAGCALLLVTGWLLGDPATPRGDALKTGGLAGGAILALYALWINDRRRRTEEARHEVERNRAQQDRERTENEQFAKAVELLGHDADQVRVGALHALAGLARNRPAYTQTVLDVLCSYLRRPFTHPSYAAQPDNPDEAIVEPDEAWPAERIAEADREQQVRLTAQRLIAALLPRSEDEDAALYDLDLTAAHLEYLDLTGRRLGRLIARRARLHGANRLGRVRVDRPALFSGATFHGRTDLHRARFDGGLSLLNAEVKGLWRVPDASVRDFADLRTAAPGQQVGELTLVGDCTLKAAEDSGWATRPG
ncbi:pentapeptide repeat-containing protein [Amycolatopsis sp. NPDC004378]